MYVTSIIHFYKKENVYFFHKKGTASILENEIYYNYLEMNTKVK